MRFCKRHGDSRVVNTFEGVVSGDDGTELRVARGYLNLVNPANGFKGRLVVGPEAGLAYTMPPGVNLWANGAVLDLNDPGKCFVVPSLEGFTSVTNGDLMISGNWTVDRDGIEGGCKLHVDEKLFFGEGAKIVLGGVSPLRRGTYVLAETTGGISGLPRQGAVDGAWLTFSSDTVDGVTRLRMTCSKGLSVVIR